MRNKKIVIVAALLGFMFIANDLTARQLPKGLVTDHRIKLVNYDPDNVVHIQTTFGYATTIELQKGEYVTESPGIGKGAGWDIASQNYSNLIIVKPKMENNTTNLNVTTNRGRTYTFLLSATESTQNNTFRVRFMYSNEKFGLFGTPSQTYNIIRNFGNPTDLNADYSFSGDKLIAPIAAKDNGTLTLLKFRKGSPIPAILSVDPKTRRESLVNYRMQQGYVIVDGIYPQYTLRYGAHVTCLFNDRAINELKNA